MSASDVAPYGTPRALAWALAAVSVLAMVPALVLAGLNAQGGQLSAGRVGICIVVAAAVVLYAGVGRLIASRLPGNAIGWLLCLVGLLSAVSVLTEQYALYAVATSRGAFPDARVAGWLSGTLGVAVIVLLSLLVLLFPDGRLPSRRWRPVLWAIGVVAAGWLAAQMQAGITVAGGYAGALAAAGVDYPNPVGIFPRHGWFSTLITADLGLGLITGLARLRRPAHRRLGSRAVRLELGRAGPGQLGYPGDVGAHGADAGGGHSGGLPGSGAEVPAV